jgi:hypothetical protein
VNVRYFLALNVSLALVPVSAWGIKPPIEPLKGVLLFEEMISEIQLIDSAPRVCPGATEAEIPAPAPGAAAKPLRHEVSIEEAQQLFNELTSARELPFHYENTGCQDRAHWIARRLEEKGIYSQKVFIQGSFKRPTRYSTPDPDYPKDRGCVRWRYHVAPTVLVRTRWHRDPVPYVIDPVIAPKPIPYKKWRDLTAPWPGWACSPIRQEDHEPLSSEELPCQIYFTERFHYDPNDSRGFYGQKLERRTAWPEGLDDYVRKRLDRFLPVSRMLEQKAAQENRTGHGYKPSCNDEKRKTDGDR